MPMSLGSYASRVVATLVVATDGTGDYTDIQTAIDNLPATGGCIYVKEGTYTITASITITSSNVSIIGCGAGTIIYVDDSADINALVVGNGVNAYRNIFLSQFKIDGNSANQGVDKYGIYFRAFITDSIINVVWVDDFKGKGIRIYNECKYNIIDSCIIRDSTGMAIEIVDGCEQNTITNCQVVSNSQGIVIDDGSQYTTIGHNRCSQNTYDGIWINSDRAIIINNICIVNGDNGIETNDADRTIINGNSLFLNGDTGIALGAATSQTIVTDNQAYQNTVSQITDGGAGNDVSHNITA